MIGIKKIEKIKFELLSPKEIRDMAVTKIITPDTYDDDGYPIEMGLMDTRLGITEPSLKCKTCGGRVGTCPGHFGYIDLAEPIIHPGFTKYIKLILEKTCSECGTMLSRTEGKDKRELVCNKCGTKQRKIILDKPTTFREILKKEDREEAIKLTPKTIRERLEKVGNPECGNQKEDLIKFGLNPDLVRPEWMLLTVLPIPPVNMRPTITLESGERSEDDLTHKLVDVIRINQRLQENKDAGAPQLIIEDLW